MDYSPKVVATLLPICSIVANKSLIVSATWVRGTDKMRHTVSVQADGAFLGHHEINCMKVALTQYIKLFANLQSLLFLLPFNLYATDTVHSLYCIHGSAIVFYCSSELISIFVLFFFFLKHIKSNFIFPRDGQKCVVIHWLY